MSEDVSAIVRSNQPASLKRRRAEDLDSGGSIGQLCCTYKGCRSEKVANVTGGKSRQFCSETHRDYFNAELYDVIKNGVSHVTEEQSGICKLRGCKLPVWEGFDFCRFGHAVQYREDMTEKWDLDNRLCRLQSCFHHIYVDEKKKILSEYCCRLHQLEAAGARGKQAAAAKRKLKAAAGTDGGKDPVSGDEIPKISTYQEAPQQLLQAKVENQIGYHDKVSGDKTIETCLRRLFVAPGDFGNADPSELFCRAGSLDFHPWDEVTEFEGFKPRWYLHYIDSKKGRERFTKEGFGWKQKGRKHSNKDMYKPLKSTYFTYELKPSSKGYSKDDHCDGYMLAYRQYEEAREAKMLKKGTSTRWARIEYSLPDNILMEVTGGILPRRIPVMSKIYQKKDGQPVWPPLPQKRENRAREVISNKDSATVPVGSIPVVHCLVEGRGMTSSISSNALPPGESLFPGREILQNAFSNDFELFDIILQESLAKGPVMEEIADKSEALNELLPHLNYDDSSPSSSSPGEGFHPTNYDCSFGDNWMDLIKWDMDSNSWFRTPTDAATSLPDQLGPCYWPVE